MEHPRYSWQGKHLLIVEDDAYSTLLLETILSQTGARLTIVGSGERAVQKIRWNSRFDLILMDIRLSGISGLEATALIRDLAPGIPIIAQTAHAMVGDMERCLDAGCDAYLTKPLDLDRLLHTINQLLSQGIPSQRVEPGQLIG